MSFRITQSMIRSNTLDNLQASLGRSQALQNQMSSGKIINKPSDDPTGAKQSLQYRSEIARANTYSSNADDGIGWLATADTTLTSTLTSIRRVRELVLAGANGTADAESRAALAKEVSALKDGMVGLANASYNERPIFGGTSDSTSAFDTAGNFLGNDGAIYRTVGQDASVQVNLSGNDVYGTGTNSLFSIVSDIVSRLESNTPEEINKLTQANGGIPGDLERLDAARVNIQNQLSTVGARQHRVETMQDRVNDSITQLKANLSKTEDADLPATFVALSIQNSAYQAALAATSKVIQPSLVDFLR